MAEETLQSVKRLKIGNAVYSFKATHLWDPTGNIGDKSLEEIWNQILGTLQYKGTITAGADPGTFTPSAQKGDVYITKLGTGTGDKYIDGVLVENGDMWIANTDTVAATADNYKTIVANWDIVQGNIDALSIITGHTHNFTIDTTTGDWQPSADITKTLTFTGKADSGHTHNVTYTKTTYTNDTKYYHAEFQGDELTSTGTLATIDSGVVTIDDKATGVAIDSQGGELQRVTTAVDTSTGSAGGHTHTVKTPVDFTAKSTDSSGDHTHTVTGTVTYEKADMFTDSQGDHSHKVTGTQNLSQYFATTSQLHGGDLDVTKGTVLNSLGSSYTSNSEQVEITVGTTNVVSAVSPQYAQNIILPTTTDIIVDFTNASTSTTGSHNHELSYTATEGTFSNGVAASAGGHTHKLSTLTGTFTANSVSNPGNHSHTVGSNSGYVTLITESKDYALALYDSNKTLTVKGTPTGDIDLTRSATLTSDFDIDITIPRLTLTDTTATSTSTKVTAQGSVSNLVIKQADLKHHHDIDVTGTTTAGQRS